MKRKTDFTFGKRCFNSKVGIEGCQLFLYDILCKVLPKRKARKENVDKKMEESDGYHRSCGGRI